MSAISSITTRMPSGVCSAGFRTTQLPAASAGASFQVAISIGKFHGNDLADDAERLVEMIGDGVVVDLGNAAFLGAHRAGEIAPMIDDQRHVGSRSSRGSACRCRASRRARAGRDWLPACRRSCSGCARARRPESCPRRPWPCGRRRAPVRCRPRWSGELAELLAGDRARIVEIAALRPGRPICRR